MAQYLAMPINQSQITACYQEDSPGYYCEWDEGGHFGVDMIGSPNPFYCSGNGEVIKVGGQSNVGVGYYAVIRYYDVVGYGDLIVRYFHLQSVPALKAGQKVTLDTKIGTYSNTGVLNMGKHLHVEVDTDLKNPLYTPTLTGNAGGLFAGLRGSGDTTVNPLLVFKKKISAPENQTVGISQSYCKYHPDEAYVPASRINAIGSFK